MGGNRPGSVISPTKKRKDPLDALDTEHLKRAMPRIFSRGREVATNPTTDDEA
jgi:hypothetical protein